MLLDFIFGKYPIFRKKKGWIWALLLESLTRVYEYICSSIKCLSILKSCAFIMMNIFFEMLVPQICVINPTELMQRF
ncbi:hypothetical protein BpHYR1_020067 [Brachionus plicatilis]|uniref:Uncharacterized protein n=1 Tax=Brachionus plicatilis TaxID=10195 RepID=A0A3M7QYR9_BRAPC|nr:hypothetical protein BpHYR1_020067 [Brachionus plicatilis]